VPPVLPELRITGRNDIDTNLGVQPGLCFNDIVQFVVCKNCNPHEFLSPSSVHDHLRTENRDVNEDTAQARVDVRFQLARVKYKGHFAAASRVHSLIDNLALETSVIDNCTARPRTDEYTLAHHAISPLEDVPIITDGLVCSGCSRTFASLHSAHRHWIRLCPNATKHVPNPGLSRWLCSA
jgi:hypothetical protein